LNVLPQTIRGKLASAFAAIALTTIVAGFLTHSSYDTIGEKIAIITDESVPSVVSAQRVASITGQIAATVPALHAADSEATLVVLLEDQDAQMIQLDTEINTLARLSGETENVRNLKALAGEVATSLTVQTANVRIRIAIAEQLGVMVETLAQEHIRFNAVIQPQVEVEKRAIRSTTLEVAESSRESVKRLNQLTMRGLLPILLLRVHASNMGRMIIAAGSATTEEEVHSLWEGFVAENVDAYIQLDNLRDNEMVADLLDIAPAERIFRQLQHGGQPVRPPAAGARRVQRRCGAAAQVRLGSPGRGAPRGARGGARWCHRSDDHDGPRALGDGGARPGYIRLGHIEHGRHEEPRRHHRSAAAGRPRQPHRRCAEVRGVTEVRP
jgi:hypothetical protein